MAPELTNAKTPLPKTTVKMKTDLKSREPGRRIATQKAQMPGKCRFSRFPGIFLISRAFPDFSGFWPKSPISGNREKIATLELQIALEPVDRKDEIRPHFGSPGIPIGNSQVSATARIPAANILFMTACSDLICPTRHIRLFLFDRQKTKVFMEKGNRCY